MTNEQAALIAAAAFIARYQDSTEEDVLSTARYFLGWLESDA